MTVVETGEWILIALGVILIVVLVVGYSLLLMLRDIRVQSLIATALLRDIHTTFSTVMGTLQEITQILVEGSLRDLRRLAESTQAALARGVRELRRATESTQVAEETGGGAARRENSSPSSVAIVRAGETRVFELLREKVASVMWDRRRGERRTASQAIGTERRGGDRRRPPPPTWETLGFILASSPRPPDP